MQPRSGAIETATRRRALGPRSAVHRVWLVVLVATALLAPAVPSAAASAARAPAASGNVALGHSGALLHHAAITRSASDSASRGHGWRPPFGYEPSIAMLGALGLGIVGAMRRHTVPARRRHTAFHRRGPPLLRTTA